MTVLAISVTNILYLLTLASGTNIDRCHRDLKGVRYDPKTDFRRKDGFYNFRDSEIYVYISDKELESYVTLWAGVSIGTKNSASTDLGRAITAALSSLF